MAKEMKPRKTYTRRRAPQAVKELQNDLLSFLKDVRAGLREPWIEKMSSFGFLSGKAAEAVSADYDILYDALLDCFETGECENERRRGPEESIVSATALRDLIEGPLLQRFADSKLPAALSLYLPIMNNMISNAAVELLSAARNRLDEEQQIMLEQSTPVLQISRRLLMLPIIGLVDSFRARRLTEALLEAVSSNRAEVAVIDLTGVATIDSAVANYLIQTAEAVRLMGAKVFFTGLSGEIAKTLVKIGVDLGKITVLGDLQSGIEAGVREISQVEDGIEEAA